MEKWGKPWKVEENPGKVGKKQWKSGEKPWKVEENHLKSGGKTWKLIGQHGKNNTGRQGKTWNIEDS